MESGYLSTMVRLARLLWTLKLFDRYLLDYNLGAYFLDTELS